MAQNCAFSLVERQLVPISIFQKRSGVFQGERDLVHSGIHDGHNDSSGLSFATHTLELEANAIRLKRLDLARTEGIRWLR